MPITKGCNVRVVVDGIDLSSQSSGAQLAAAMGVAEYFIMTDCAAQKEPTRPAVTLAHNGYFTGEGATAFEEALKARLASATDVRVAFIILPSIFYLLRQTWADQMSLDAPVEEMLTVEGNWAEAGQVARGRVILGGSVATGTVSAVLDLGAARIGTPGTLFFAASGYTDGRDVTILVEGSANGTSGWSTVRSQLLADVGDAEFAVASLVRYLRATITFAGGGSINAYTGII